MSAPAAYYDLAQAIVRHLAPLYGIVVLGWSAQNVLLLYFADTLLAIAVMMSGLLRSFAPPVDDDGWAARINGEVGAIGGGAFVAAIFVIPLGFPLVFMLQGFDARAALSDPMLRTGLAWQVAAAAWSYAGLYQQLKRRTPEELGIKRRFSLVLLRWILLIMAAGTGVGALFGRHGPLLFVAIYAALSIWIEIAPDRLLRALPVESGSAHAPGAGTGTAPGEKGGRRKRR